MAIYQELDKLIDLNYKAYTSKLIPNISKDNILGVRIPLLRKMVKSLSTVDKINFIHTLPHKYLEENLLHSLILNELHDFDLCIKEINTFLPFIDNWSVCDTLKPKVLNNSRLINSIKTWILSDHEYTVRFGVNCLMNYFLGSNYRKDYLKLPLKIKIDYYYVNIGIAWYYSTALVKAYDDTIKIIQNKKLKKWIHNKTIQKAIESYRISDNKKNYLKTLLVR